MSNYNLYLGNSIFTTIKIEPISNCIIDEYSFDNKTRVYDFFASFDGDHIGKYFITFEFFATKKNALVKIETAENEKDAYKLLNFEKIGPFKYETTDQMINMDKVADTPKKYNFTFYTYSSDQDEEVYFVNFYFKPKDE